jgi:hypothetical protein
MHNGERTRNGDRFMYALTTTFEDVERRRPDAKRHLMPEGQRHVTMCGRRVREVCDWYTPLLSDCRQCMDAAMTRDARMRSSR